MDSRPLRGELPHDRLGLGLHAVLELDGEHLCEHEISFDETPRRGVRVKGSVRGRRCVWPDRDTMGATGSAAIVSGSDQHRSLAIAYPYKT